MSQDLAYEYENKMYDYETLKNILNQKYDKERKLELDNQCKELQKQAEFKKKQELDAFMNELSDVKQLDEKTNRVIEMVKFKYKSRLERDLSTCKEEINGRYHLIIYKLMEKSRKEPEQDEDEEDEKDQKVIVYPETSPFVYCKACLGVLIDHKSDTCDMVCKAAASSLDLTLEKGENKEGPLLTKPVLEKLETLGFEKGDLARWCPICSFKHIHLPGDAFDAEYFRGYESVSHCKNGHFWTWNENQNGLVVFVPK